MKQLLLIIGLLTLYCDNTFGKKYEPNWPSLDARPLPAWYDDAKVGIFLHFGVFSVPSFKSEWFWCYWKCPGRVKKDVVQFMKDNYRPDFTYQDFGHELTLEFFDANEWAKLFKKAGAKYVVLTTKHHEGFTMWPSKYSFGWNAMDIGPKRDVVGEYSKAIREANLHLGLYHSLFEWFNPMYLQDSKNKFKTRYYAENKAIPELHELVNNYKPDLIWSDGDAGPVDYWNSTGFLAWLYNDSPVKENIVVNDRWGTGTSCKHGGYWNCADRYNPGKGNSHKWENAMTLDPHSWGYRREMNIGDVLTLKTLIKTLAETISNGGNILVNVGPSKDGKIPVIFQERLLGMGSWLELNGEGIYGTKRWISHNDTVTPEVYYTQSKTESIVYATFMNWPSTYQLVLGLPKVGAQTKFELIGSTGKVKVDKIAKGIRVTLPDKVTLGTNDDSPAWMLKMTSLANVL